MSAPAASGTSFALLPYQQAFIEKFFDGSSARTHLLRSEPGLGASYATAHLVHRALAKTPDARILMLVPKALQAQTQDVLSDMGVKADAVDRFRYREMQDRAPLHGTIWPDSMVAILSVDFAKQEDIAHSLATAPWTLMIVQEAHLVRGLRHEMVRQIIDSSPNLRILLTSPTGADHLSAIGIEHIETTIWRRVHALDHAGKAMLPHTETRLEIFEFREAAADQFLREFVEDMVGKFPTNSEAARLGKVFRRSLASSPPALEASLRRFRNRLAPGFLTVATSEGDDDDEESISALTSTKPEDKQIAALNECLVEIDKIPGDSKFEEFVEKIVAKRNSDTPPARIMILAEYRATLFYLQAQLEDSGFKTNIIHGAMTFDEREQSVGRFKAEGGLMLATISTMNDGLDLSQVDELVMYDLPSSKLKLEQIYGRFQQFGRTKPLKLMVLYNLDDPDPTAAKSLDILREIVAVE